MAESENQKYHCGCGKSYVSYPAYSTHKRLKHGNQSMLGTQLPNEYAPKRGRPTFSLPNQSLAAEHSFSALTTIEVTLLRMEEKYGKVLTYPDAEANMSYLEEYVAYQKKIGCKAGQELTCAIKNFSEIVLHHTNEGVGAAVSKLLLQITFFLLENIKSSEIDVLWQENDKKPTKIDPFLFNKFFARKGQQNRTAQLAKTANKPLTFMFEIVVALSQYLCKLNIISCKLLMKK